MLKWLYGRRKLIRQREEEEVRNLRIASLSCSSPSESPPMNWSALMEIRYLNTKICSLPTRNLLEPSHLESISSSYLDDFILKYSVEGPSFPVSVLPSAAECVIEMPCLPVCAATGDIEIRQNEVLLNRAKEDEEKDDDEGGERLLVRPSFSSKRMKARAERQYRANVKSFAAHTTGIIPSLDRNSSHAHNKLEIFNTATSINTLSLQVVRPSPELIFQELLQHANSDSFTKGRKGRGLKAGGVKKSSFLSRISDIRSKIAASQPLTSDTFVEERLSPGIGDHEKTRKFDILFLKRRASL